MGTRIQYAINPLAESRNSNFDVNWLADSEFFLNNLERAALDKFQKSSDRMLEQHNIEHIKKTMLMQEDMFKQQVQELHRLHSVQKMLMNEMKNVVKQSRCCASDIHYSHFSTRASTYTCHVQSVRENVSSSEPSGEASTMLRAFDLEKPAQEDASTGLSAMEESQAGPSSRNYPKNYGMDMNECSEECDIELTLSIGGGFARKKSNGHQIRRVSAELGCSSKMGNKFGEIGSAGSIKTDIEEECSVPGSDLSSSSATVLNQQSDRPHWLFQDLSLNRT